MLKYWIIAAALFLALGGCDNLDDLGENSNGTTALLPPPPKISAEGVSTNSVKISWEAVAGALEGYNVYRSNSAGGVYEKINPLPVFALTYLDRGLNPDTSYYYMASAEGGRRSNFCSGKTSSGLLPAPSKISAEALSPDSVKILWEAVPGASFYNVFRSNSPGGVYERINPELVAGLTYTDTGLDKNTAYYYRASADGGERSVYCSAATGSGLLPAPSKISAEALSPDSVKILWEAVPGASAYNVFRSNSPGGVYETINPGPVAGLTYTDMGLDQGVYYYKAAAEGGERSAYCSAAVSPGPQGLDPPSGFKGSANRFTVTLSWNQTDGASFYKIYYAPDSGGGEKAWVSIATVAASGRGGRYTHRGAYYGNNYYKISTLDSAGVEGKTSAEIVLYISR